MKGLREATFGGLFHAEFGEKDVLRSWMQEEVRQCAETIQQIRQELEQMPTGRITRKLNKGQSRYLYVDTSGIAHYVRNADRKFAETMLRKRLLEKSMKLLLNNEKALSDCLRKYQTIVPSELCRGALASFRNSSFG